MFTTQTAHDVLTALTRAGFELYLPISVAPMREDRHHRALVAAGRIGLNLSPGAWVDTEMWAVVAAYVNVHGLKAIPELQAEKLRLTAFETGAANTVIELAARIESLSVVPGLRAA